MIDQAKAAGADWTEKGVTVPAVAAEIGPSEKRCTSGSLGCTTKIRVASDGALIPRCSCQLN